MLVGKLAICSMIMGVLMVGPAMAQKAGVKKNKRYAPRIEAVQPKALRSDADRQRDPLGIIQRQGISSLYGGMGNMGGGSGRSANTGVGLGAHGNSQGPRF
jgi:hypothetical protein